MGVSLQVSPSAAARLACTRSLLGWGSSNSTQAAFARGVTLTKGHHCCPRLPCSVYTCLLPRNSTGTQPDTAHLSLVLETQKSPKIFGRGVLHCLTAAPGSQRQRPADKTAQKSAVTNEFKSLNFLPRGAAGAWHCPALCSKPVASRTRMHMLTLG